MSVSVQELLNLVKEYNEIQKSPDKKYSAWMRKNLHTLSQRAIEAAASGKTQVEIQTPVCYMDKHWHGQPLAEFLKEEIFPGCWVKFQYQEDEWGNDGSEYIIIGWVKEEEEKCKRKCIIAGGSAGGLLGADDDW